MIDFEKIIKDTNRKVIIDSYEDYLLSKPELMTYLYELNDKVFGL